MTVNITFSNEAGGYSLSDTVDLGSSLSPGDPSSIQDMFVRHDGANDITACAFYLTAYAGGSYPAGGEGADQDFVEIMGWGDDAAGVAQTGNHLGDVDNGGFQICQVIPGGWTAGTDFDFVTEGQIFRNNKGDINVPIELLATAVTGTPSGDGEIPASEQAHVQVRCVVPDPLPDPYGAGARACSLVLAYSATS